MDIDVVDAPKRERFEARTADGSVAGYAAYRRGDGVVVFVHTEVDDADEGQGGGSRLVRGALDAVRADGAGVQPLCPFVAA